MCFMIRGNFLTPEQRRSLTILARKATAEHRVARRANALVLLDRGKSCEEGIRHATSTLSLTAAAGQIGVERQRRVSADAKCQPSYQP